MAKAPTPTPAPVPFIACLQRAVDTKQLKPSQFEKAKARFGNLRDEYIAKGMVPLDAANRAADEATEGFAIENRETKRRKLNQMRANILAWKDIQSWKGKDKSKGWKAFFDGPYDEAAYESYARLKEGFEGMLHASLNGLIAKYKPKFAGIVRPKAGLSNIVKEIFGETTGDAEAKALAAAWKDTHELAVKLFRMVGGSIRELASWHLPQHQDYLKLTKAGQDKWVADHLNWLDWDKTRRADGSMAITQADREAFLREAFTTLQTDGANHLKLDQTPMRSNFSNKLDKHRVLQFKDAASWQAMHDAYGSGSVFDVLLQHTNDMAHEIALVKRFGPSPETTVFNIGQMIRKLAPTPGQATDEIRAMEAVFSSVMRETGLARTNRIGNILAGTRNLLTSALLGGAPLIAIPSDLNTALLAKHFNGLDGMHFMRRYLSLMNPANKADRQLAVRLGLIAETVQAQMYGMRRMIGLDISGPSWTRRVADVSMNLNVLSPHTQMARWAFGMEMLGLFADNAGKTFDQLSFKTMFERHGLTAADWDRFRQAPVFSDPRTGATFLRPDDVFVAGDRKSLDLMTRLKSMVLDEVKTAILTPDLVSRNALIRDTDPGTFPGELTRSAAMFKNFGVTFVNILMRRYMMNAHMSGRSRLALGGYLVLSMTMLGALRQQLGNITNGNDPQDMKDPRFIFRALVTGGGFGIFGDFVFGDYNRQGGDPITSLAGPVAQEVSDLYKLTGGNVRELLEHKDTHFWRELVQTAQRYTPGSRNWWSRLIVDRTVWDALLSAVDPKAGSNFDENNKRLKREYGLTSWWEQGEKLPDRPPSLLGR